MTKQDRKNKRSSNKKRAKHWNLVRNERDTLRAEYDQKFANHLNRIKSLNEVRTHAMAAAKRNGFGAKETALDMEKDQTRYTSSKQVFSQIQQKQDAEAKRKLSEKRYLTASSVPEAKKRKIMAKKF